MIEFRSAQQCQALDRIAIQQAQMPGLLLMKRAGFSAFQWLTSLAEEAKSVLVVCGTGNNGGDGYVLAQLALLAGWRVKCIQLGDAAKIKGDALLAYQEWQAIGGQSQTYSEAVLAEALAQADWVVDAILGTGLQRKVGGEYQRAIAQINASACKVMALDIASGLSADTGNCLGVAVQADVTATFISHKIGLVTADGPDVSGEVCCFDLDLPIWVFEEVPAIAFNRSFAEMGLPKRQRNSHKGTYGTALLIGGNQTMMGAIELAGAAALRAGAGLVKIVTKTEHQTLLTVQQPELMVYHEAALSEQMPTAKALAIGPGLGQDAWSQSLLKQALDFDGPKVLDADALNCLAKTPCQKSDWVLTPHPAEAARLLGMTTQQVQQDRLLAVKKLHQRYGGVIVLKGSGSLVTDGEQTFVCSAGNPGMAVGGMGDVLTGILAGLLAQGIPTFQAACLAVQWHAETGDRVASKNLGSSVLPSELVQCLSCC